VSVAGPTIAGDPGDQAARVVPGRRPSYPPVHARAVVLNGSELEDTILLAMDDDPAAVLIAELAEHGWNIARNGPLYCVSGAFTNPVTAAARVATQLGQHFNLVLVHARTAEGWVLIAWRRPDLVLAYVPANTWRHYRIHGSIATQRRGSPAAKDSPQSGWLASQCASDRPRRQQFRNCWPRPEPITSLSCGISPLPISADNSSADSPPGADR
jgi:hypothetical protein